MLTYSLIKLRYLMTEQIRRELPILSLILPCQNFLLFFHPLRAHLHIVYRHNIKDISSGLRARSRRPSHAQGPSGSQELGLLHQCIFCHCIHCHKGYKFKNRTNLNQFFLEAVVCYFKIVFSKNCLMCLKIFFITIEEAEIYQLYKK